MLKVEKRMERRRKLLSEKCTELGLDVIGKLIIKFDIYSIYLRNCVKKIKTDIGKNFMQI